MSTRELPCVHEMCNCTKLHHGKENVFDTLGSQELADTHQYPLGQHPASTYKNSMKIKCVYPSEVASTDITECNVTYVINETECPHVDMHQRSKHMHVR